MTQYLVFQHLKRQQQELLVVLAFDEDHEKLFPDLPLIGFKKNKNLKSNLVRTLLPDINETGVNHVVKRDLMFNYAVTWKLMSNIMVVPWQIFVAELITLTSCIAIFGNYQTKRVGRHIFTNIIFRVIIMELGTRR